jgi:hypothetical protein
LLSPVDLLEQAEEFASRIPAGPEYEEDRNSSWVAIGEAWLKLRDGARATQALEKIDHPRCRAAMRHAIVMWRAHNPLFERGPGLLTEIAECPQHFTPSELQEMVPPMYQTLGAKAVVEYAERIENPYAASQVLVTLSHFLSAIEQRRSTLELAEQLAAGAGDRALRCVRDGYRATGLWADASRVELKMVVHPKELDEPLIAAEKALADAIRVVEQYDSDAPMDTPCARLGRYLDYKFNDLKVRFLADSAMAGGVADDHVESILLGTEFCAIEAPRAPSVFRNPCATDFPAFLFARPVRRHEDDRELLDGSDYFREPSPEQPDVQRCAVELFRDFPSIVREYSLEQVDQGLWLLLGGSIYDGILFDESMLIPFRDYYAHCGERYEGSAFYMWWDLVKPDGIAILQQILALPSSACQSAALHGLNHFENREQAFAVTNRYIEENRDRLTAEELDHAEKCRDGRMQ